MIKNYVCKLKFYLYYVFLYDCVFMIKIMEYIWFIFIWYLKIFNLLYDIGLFFIKFIERYVFLLIIFGNLYCYIVFYLCNLLSVVIFLNRKKFENKLNWVWKIWLKFMGV